MSKKSGTKEVHNLSSNASPDEVIKAYTDLQTFFQKVYKEQQEKKNKDNLKKLDALRATIVQKVTSYQDNPVDIRPLAEEVQHSAAVLTSMSSTPLPSKLSKEVQSVKPTVVKKETKPLPVKVIPKKEEKKPAAKSDVKKELVTRVDSKQETEKKEHKGIFGMFKKDKSKVAEKEEMSKDGKHKASDKKGVVKKDPATVTSAEIMTPLPKPEIQKAPKGELLDEYEVESNGARVKVKIIKGDLGVSYNLFIPPIQVPTAMLLTEVRNELISITNISMKELTDPKSFNKIKEKFTLKAKEVIKEKLPHIEQETETFLIGQLIQDMLGLGKIEYLINDSHLEEIVIQSSKEPIRVYTKQHGWLSSNVRIEREEDIINYANIIARRVGRQINVLSPLLDAHLVTGDRINAVLYPISTKGNNITIRKFARDPYTIIDLISNKTCDLDTAALVWLGIEYEMNVLISGGTASGKTVFLNACMPFIPPNQKVLSIEDTRELMLPEFLYWDPLVTRTANPEGKGEVSMLHLLVNSLRMRPDRIILGEMRRHEEAMVLFEAMHTGHSVYATLHAESGAETVSRLVNPPLSVPPNLLKAVNLNVIMFRDRRRGLRRVFQIAEFTSDGNNAKANILYRWIPEEDRIIQHNDSNRFFEDIGRHTGLSQAGIRTNLEEKKKILTWLIKNKVRDLKSFGTVMNYYYRNKEALDKAMRKNDIKSILVQQAHTKKESSKDEKQPKKGKHKVKKKKSSTRTSSTRSHAAKKSSKKKKTAKKKTTKKSGKKKRSTKKKVTKKKTTHKKISKKKSSSKKKSRK